MFDFDGAKFIIIGIVALLVIGPKDLPRVLRQIGQWTGKLRRMASEFQGQFMDAMREADIDSIKKEVRSVADTARLETRFDPLSDIRREIGSIKTDLKSTVALGSTAAAGPHVPVPETQAISAEGADQQRGTIAATTDVAATSVSSSPPASPSRAPPRPPGTIGSLPTKVPFLGSDSGPL